MDVDSNTSESDAQVPSLLSEELSGSTLAALQEFLIDRQKAESVADPFAENWGMSQFWYDSKTAATVAAEVLTLTDNGILPSVCIACPSLFRELKVNSHILVSPFVSIRTYVESQSWCCLLSVVMNGISFKHADSNNDPQTSLLHSHHSVHEPHVTVPFPHII